MQTEHDIAHKKKTKEKYDIPKKYNVIMYNDDFTSMQFVIFILEQIFYKKEEEAYSLMLEIHNKGKAIVGNYSKEIAETKVSLCLYNAKKYEFPLFCEVVEE